MSSYATTRFPSKVALLHPLVSVFCNSNAEALPAPVITLVALKVVVPATLIIELESRFKLQLVTSKLPSMMMLLPALLVNVPVPKLIDMSPVTVSLQLLMRYVLPPSSFMVLVVHLPSFSQILLLLLKFVASVTVTTPELAILLLPAELTVLPVIVQWL